jgi:predicted Zn-dependent peptidase
MAVAFPAPKESDEANILQRAVTSVMSGGMSGRLFTEVREKRSLCYSVYASYAAGRDRGAVQVYAGTTPERAQETLDVIMSEYRRLRDGVDLNELNRAIAGMKSRLVMNRESTSARAAGMAHDQYLIGRARTLQELEDRIESITLERVNSYLGSRFNNLKCTIVTLGPTALDPAEAEQFLK